MSDVEERPKVAFIAHCFLNQNAKVSEFARCAGVVTPIVGILRESGYEIAQLPCPEMSYLGVARWWQSREMYDNPGYREHCRTLALPVVEQIREFESLGYDVVLIGLDGSPSSGVRLTGTMPSWGGRPEGAEKGGSTRIPGRGVWIEVLAEVLEENGIAFPRATGVPMDAQGFDMKAGMEELSEFLRESA
jgi:predicted secreted protein